MKEKYFKPQAEADEFKKVDVLTTSYNDLQDDDNPVDGSQGW